LQTSEHLSSDACGNPLNDFHPFAIQNVRRVEESLGEYGIEADGWTLMWQQMKVTVSKFQHAPTYVKAGEAL
jgi:hypothetical protein